MQNQFAHMSQLKQWKIAKQVATLSPSSRKQHAVYLDYGIVLSTVLPKRYIVDSALIKVDDTLSRLPIVFEHLRNKVHIIFVEVVFLGLLKPIA